MGISLGDAKFIEIDTYFELMDISNEAAKSDSKPKTASQADIDNFLL